MDIIIVIIYGLYICRYTRIVVLVILNHLNQTVIFFLIFNVRLQTKK